ncbi:cytochrome P450 [Sphingobium sp. AR-3-1]|uniref:Cytochrome P450 n=1 Tax=Sphingobium psychrophilum TaxID=2728834 RepID=A0A7X9ZUW6_9SPHN|nr:cytochrome P450 [Sphingobium psychrophilum]NML13177.1 cytochrome P450 [Sphingobium psychrophilum]
MSEMTLSTKPRIPPLDEARFLDVDLFGQELKANPAPYFTQWAKSPPFYAMVQGHAHVVISRHAQVQWALRTHDIISAVPHKGWGTDLFDYFNGLPLVVDYDPPEHSRVRRLMQPGFTPSRVAKIQPLIEGMVDELALAVAEKKTFDMVTEFAGPLMYRVLLGGVFEFDPEIWPIFINLSNALELVATVPPGAPKPAAYMEAFNAVHDFCGRLIEERRVAPKDDLVGTVIAAHDEKGSISIEELFSTLVQLFTAGLGTVTATSSNAVLRLLRHPDQLALLRADPSLLNKALEECMRIDCLGNFRHRFVVKEHVIDGTPIYPGMVAHMSLGAANYDPDKYPDPARFDITRDPRDILTFGFGPHLCPGNILARMVTRAIVGRLVFGFPHLRLAHPDDVIICGGMPTERFPTHVNLRVD